MTVYQLVYNYLRHHKTFHLQEYSDSTYTYKLKGKMHYLKLDKKKKHQWLKVKSTS